MDLFAVRFLYVLGSGYLCASNQAVMTHSACSALYGTFLLELHYILHLTLAFHYRNEIFL